MCVFECMRACVFWERNISTAEPKDIFLFWMALWLWMQPVRLCAPAKSKSTCLCLCLRECLCERNAHVAAQRPRLQEAALFFWRGFCPFGSKSRVLQRRREGFRTRCRLENFSLQKLETPQQSGRNQTNKTETGKWGFAGLRQVKCFCWWTRREAQPEQGSAYPHPPSLSQNSPRCLRKWRRDIWSFRSFIPRYNNGAGLLWPFSRSRNNGREPEKLPHRLAAPPAFFLRPSV